MNGSAIVAMAGHECFAIGSDLRFGVQFQTLATDYRKVYKIHDQLFLGLAGLGTDTQTLCASPSIITALNLTLIKWLRGANAPKNTQHNGEC